MPVNNHHILNIAQAGGNAPLSIEREQGKKGAATGIIYNSTMSFKGKVLQFLAHVPLLKGEFR